MGLTDRLMVGAVRRCIACNQFKPKSEFEERWRSRRYGKKEIAARCHECMGKFREAHRIDSPESNSRIGT